MTVSRQTILDAAAELIAEHGVRALSFREVARRARVSHQAPYHFFASAQGILHEIATQGFRELNRSMRAAAQRQHPKPLGPQTPAGKMGPAPTGVAPKDAIQALEAAGIAYVRFSRSHLGHFRVMFQGSIVAIHNPLSPLPEALETHATLVELVREARSAGAAPALDEATHVTLAWATVHGLATLLCEGTLAAKAPGQDVSDLIAESVVTGLGALMRQRARTSPHQDSPRRSRSRLP